MMLVDFPIVQRTWGRESLGFFSVYSVFGEDPSGMRRGDSEQCLSRIAIRFSRRCFVLFVMMVHVIVMKF